jgi:hypothetical protein
MVEPGQSGFEGGCLTQADWEEMWAPYDRETYQQVLEMIEAEDHVLDIGAGDLRLARQMAQKARRVTAVEVQRGLLQRGLIEPQSETAPENLCAVWADAREWPFPEGITKGVLLMRHCTHFRLYVEKMKKAGAKVLITNARWKTSVEAIDLTRTGIGYEEFEMGWYACRCGAAGFKEGPAEALTQAVERLVHEVRNCAVCAAPDPESAQPAGNQRFI